MPTLKLRYLVVLVLCIGSGLTLKCVINGEPPESKDAEPKRFEEKTEDCETDTCMTSTGTTLGSEPLLTCGPNQSDEPEYVNKCKDKDGNKLCLCDTELCNQQSHAVQIVVSNCIFISLALFALMRI